MLGRKKHDSAKIITFANKKLYYYVKQHKPKISVDQAFLA